MNIDTIRKMLCSENEEDNLLALNIIRGNSLNNWGGFLIELQDICQGYFYIQNVKKYTLTNGWQGEWKDIPMQHHLWDKYFDNLSRCELKAHWYTQID